MIFNFHDIVADGQHARTDQISVATFRQQLTWIQQHFTIVRIDTLIEQFHNNSITKPMAAVTFDDGYRSHFSLVKPILDEFEIKAAFYVSSAHLTKNYYWHDLVETFCQHSSNQQQLSLRNVLKSLSAKQLPSLIESIKYLTLADRKLVLSEIEEFTKPFMKERLLMNSSEVLALAGEGHLIGGHTLNHPILALESDIICKQEISDDLLALEALLQQIDTVPEKIRQAVMNHGGGHANHSLFWTIMRPVTPAVGTGTEIADNAPTGELAEAIASAFGTFDAFKLSLFDAGIGRFGSGWAWLVVDSKAQAGVTGRSTPALSVISTQNQDSPLMQGLTPILGIDVWEHAYYLTYQNKRDEYIKAWWNVVNWEEVARRFTAATITAAIA